MPNKRALCRSVGDGSPDLTDVIGDVVWRGTNTRLVDDTRGGDPVEILATNRDTRYQFCKPGTIATLEESCEGSNFIVDIHLTSRGPQAKEQGGICVDGCLKGIARGVGCASLDAGIETSTCEGVIGASKSLGSGEVVGELLQGYRRAICVG